MARILYVSEGYSTHDRRFLQKLAESGHDAWHLPYAADSVRYETGSLPEGIHSVAPLSRKPISPGNLNWIYAALRFRRVMREVQPEIVHAGPVQTGGFFAALCGFHPLLIMCWGSDVLAAPETSAWVRWITKFTLRRADMVLGDCDAVRERVLALGRVPEERVVTFPYGIDCGVFRPKMSELSLRQKLGWEECRVVISTRSFEASYGTMIFLDAMRRVLAKCSDVRVLMLGDGSLRRQVEAFIEGSGLKGKIHMVGRVREDALTDYFAEADLYVSAAYCDGSSISLLQAMACGLPAIVTDGSGNREWVIHRENGWLYPAGNVDALVTTVLEALDDDELRAATGKANVATVRSRANWGLNFGKLLTAYDKLLFSAAVQEVKTYAQLSNR
ncbi:MAG TPA: glycosyltransferase family 4 protein [Candidatus Acidoferrales bacterium]|nr:glycosyltransferase family 4 protein [Candidatus Acidoferrales bacterium]